VVDCDRITEFRGKLPDTLEETIVLLEADPDAWYAISDRLHRSGRLFTSATHCLREWPEPTDPRPDKQRGRCNLRGCDS
jgi:hypothetical protein